MKVLTEYDIELTNKIAKIMNDAGSDKHSDHNYSHGYAYFLSKLPSLSKINFLEIGIANVEPDKSSLHGWSKLFSDSNIYGIDIFEHKMIEKDNIKTFVANQASIVDLSRFKENAGYPKFDVILDDGSHYFGHAIVSFDYLFNSLKSHGIYMIEDVGKIHSMYGQSVYDWEEYLSDQDDLDWEVIDCRPDRIDDDSILIGIWRK